MTYKVEIKNLESLLTAKADLERHISIEHSKLLSSFYTRIFTKADYKEIRDKIATIDEQLLEVKLSIAVANATKLDEDGNVNNINIYALSIINRKLANIRELIYKGERLFEDNENKKNRGSSWRSSNLISKKTYTEKDKDLKDEEIAAEAERLIINNKLQKFNRTTDIEVKIYDEFQKFIK